MRVRRALNRAPIRGHVTKANSWAQSRNGLGFQPPITHRPLRPHLVKLIRCPVFPDRPVQLPSLVCAGGDEGTGTAESKIKACFSHRVIMTSEETQIEGIDSLIAMLELMFAYKSGYYHRLLMAHCIVQPTSWSLDSPPGFSDGGEHRSL